MSPPLIELGVAFRDAAAGEAAAGLLPPPPKKSARSSAAAAADFGSSVGFSGLGFGRAARVDATRGDIDALDVRVDVGADARAPAPLPKRGDR